MSTAFSLNNSRLRLRHGVLHRSAGVLIGAGLAWCVAAGAAESQPAAPHLSAAQVIEKHIAARGGLASWHSIQAMSWTGKMEAGGADSASRSARYVRDAKAPTNKKDLSDMAAEDAKTDSPQVQLPFTLSLERPRKSRLELQFAGKTAIQVYDGEHGWKVRPFLNRNDVEPFTAAETSSEAAKPGLDGPLMDYSTKGTKADLEGTEAVEGHTAYKLKLTAKNGDIQHIWIDAQSFLDVKVEGTARRMDGRLRTVWIYQRDFRAVQGVMVPFVLETVVDGYKDTHKILIEKVSVNPKLDNALFDKPRA